MRSQAARARLRKLQASTLLRLHQKRIRFAQWGLDHGVKLTGTVLLAITICVFIAMPHLQTLAGSYFTVTENLATLRSLLSGTGAALIGAATIGFSLVVFAMQINVERMPHGLFRQLSADPRLLGAFLGSFVLALLIAGTSLAVTPTWAVPLIAAAVLGVGAIVVLFLYAYRRALQIINPIEQLSIMTGTVLRDLQKWGRFADLSAIMHEEKSEPGSPLADAGGLGQLNKPRVMFFLANAGWDASARQAINYAMSYTKRFAVQGDYQVTENAFSKILEINAAYCQAKLGTFIATNPLVELPGTTDAFINHTLEHQRQAMQAALIDSDERLAQNALCTLGGLHAVYLQIEYPGLAPTKHHAMLAAGYLSSAVESVSAREFPDVMMEGIRQMGRAARVAIHHTDSAEIVSLVQKIGTLSYVGALKTSHQPVTRIAMEQLSLITYELLTKGEHNIDYPVRELRSSVRAAAKIFLHTADSPLAGVHSSTLGPYFSATQLPSFLMQLQHLANQILAAPENDELANRIIDNIETWADQLYDTQKDLLLLAVEKRSQFTFDAITWIIEVSNLLNAVSNAPACSEGVDEDLRKHAGWLVSTLSWLPEDEESLIFVETFSLTESLFNAALEGYRRDCIEFYLDCQNLLLGWAKKAGNHERGKDIVAGSIKALLALALIEGTPEALDRMKNRFSKTLASKGAPTEYMRVQAAQTIRDSAYRLGQHWVGRAFDHILLKQDHAKVAALLGDIADILNPKT
ncbi:hypothetical protein RNI54_001012 [Pseudomonas putida]|nr:hypothetical protein [Pseudomonas putida]